MRKDELEELVDCSYDWVCSQFVHDEDRSWRVVLLAMISTEQGTRARETRRTPGLGVSELMPRICLSSVPSRPGWGATYDLQKAANMVLGDVEIHVKMSSGARVGLHRECSLGLCCRGGKTRRACQRWINSRARFVVQRSNSHRHRPPLSAGPGRDRLSMFWPSSCGASAEKEVRFFSFLDQALQQNRSTKGRPIS